MMNLRQREREHDDARRHSAGDLTGATVTQNASSGQDYYSVVDSAINNAMSANSELFIAQSEQQNGQ